MLERLIGKCGFYCESCPSYPDSCRGCLESNSKGACYTRDCVLSKKISFCGECEDFPCETILTQEKSTVLDKAWLQWKKKEKNGG